VESAASEEKKTDTARPTFVDQAKEKFEEIQHTMDERVKTALASFRPFQQMQHEVKRLGERIEDLERKLKGGPPSSGAGGASGNGGGSK
jgi:predicted  nucleic acid-binding Zn-ribbon protein